MTDFQKSMLLAAVLFPFFYVILKYRIEPWMIETLCQHLIRCN